MPVDYDDIDEAIEGSNGIRVMRSEENKLVGIIRSVIFWPEWVF